MIPSNSNRELAAVFREFAVLMITRDDEHIKVTEIVKLLSLRLALGSYIRIILAINIHIRVIGFAGPPHPE